MVGDWKELNGCARRERLDGAHPNNSLHLTGMSLLLIESLNDDAVVPRPVNSSVRRPGEV
jgi:hypothetical protein